MTRFNHKPSADYLAAVAALEKLPPDEMHRAYADANAEISKQQWMEKRGVTESKGSTSWQRLIKRRLSDYDFLNHLPGQDHPALFIKNGKPEVFTFQPYGLSWETLKALVERCASEGLEVSISAWPAWHYPTSVLFVEVTRK